MSRLLIAQYHAEVAKIIQYGGSRKETSIRGAFQNLLNEYCKARDFLLISELDYKTKMGTVVYPDGTVKDALRNSKHLLEREIDEIVYQLYGLTEEEIAIIEESIRK